MRAFCALRGGGGRAPRARAPAPRGGRGRRPTERSEGATRPTWGEGAKRPEGACDRRTSPRAKRGHAAEPASTAARAERGPQPATRPTRSDRARECGAKRSNTTERNGGGRRVALHVGFPGRSSQSNGRESDGRALAPWRSTIVKTFDLTAVKSINGESTHVDGVRKCGGCCFNGRC